MLRKSSQFINACKNNNLEKIKKIVNDMNDINKLTCKDNVTGLMIAYSWGDSDICKYLLENNANVNAVDNKGNNCLFYTCEHSLKIIKDLIKYGINLNHQNNEGQTCLHYLFIDHSIAPTDFGYNDTKEDILQIGTNVNIIDNYGNTCFYYACKYGYLKFLKLNKNAIQNINHINDNGETYLHAVNTSNVDIIIFLVENKININKKDNNGKTYLRKACGVGNTDLVRYLLNHGAKPDESCIEIAKRSRYITIEHLLHNSIVISD